MREYIFTSPEFTGFMKFGYDAEGVLIKYENQAILSTEQQVYLSMAFPLTQDVLPKIVNKGKLLDCTDLSFERFWEEYGYKKSKAEAERYWRKMPENEKLKAVSGIKRYMYDCKKHNRDVLYAVRYLRNMRYMDE
jgi:NDP-sugar pyrophosphorylase family protein